eukprot:scaffold7579_cov107-Skeletonema_dohrnii-CCMP3373.AAC.1
MALLICCLAFSIADIASWSNLGRAAAATEMDDARAFVLTTQRRHDDDDVNAADGEIERATTTMMIDNVSK